MACRETAPPSAASPSRLRPSHAQDVRINHAPVVGLGGDFWHTPYPIGQNDAFLIRSVGEPFGVLDSDVFDISSPFLAYRLGGSASGGAAIELRVPSRTAQQVPNFPALDAPDRDDFVAVRRASPTGSDVLREFTWALGDERELARKVDSAAAAPRPASARARSTPQGQGRSGRGS